MIRKAIAVTLLAATLGGTVLPAFSAVIVRVAPPPPREEVVPAARPGYVWRGGYWDYRGHKHHWVKGTYIRERRGYHWVPHEWVEHNGRYTLRPGAWRRGEG